MDRVSLLQWYCFIWCKARWILQRRVGKISFVIQCSLSLRHYSKKEKWPEFGSISQRKTLRNSKKWQKIKKTIRKIKLTKIN